MQTVSSTQLEAGTNILVDTYDPKTHCRAGMESATVVSVEPFIDRGMQGVQVAVTITATGRPNFIRYTGEQPVPLAS